MNRKNQIIETAETLFVERGINDTRVIDIANHLKMSKKTIYKHFQGKDEIVWTLFQSRYVYVNESIEAIFRSDSSFVGKLASLVSFFRQAFARANHHYFKDMRAFSPNVDRLIDRYLQNAVFKRFRPLLINASENGILKAGVNIDTTVLIYRDAIVNFYTMRTIENLPENLLYLKPVDILCENLVTIFRGILNNSAEKEFELLLLNR